MYSSFNRFDHNVYRDATIVTTLDTFTSMLAGCTIFGILGHLAHESGTSEIGEVVKGGAGLAFISYPDAIARFKFVPQVCHLQMNVYSFASLHDDKNHIINFSVRMTTGMLLFLLFLFHFVVLFRALLFHAVRSGYWQQHCDVFMCFDCYS